MEIESLIPMFPYSCKRLRGTLMMTGLRERERKRAKKGGMNEDKSQERLQSIEKVVVVYASNVMYFEYIPLVNTAEYVNEYSRIST